MLESREKRSADPFIVQVISNNVITVARVRPSKILEMIHAPSLELSYYERLARACQRSCFQESLPTRTMCVTVLHYFTRAECARCLHRPRRNHLVTPRVGTRRYVRGSSHTTHNAQRSESWCTVVHSFLHDEESGPRGPATTR